MLIKTVASKKFDKIYCFSVLYINTELRMNFEEEQTGIRQRVGHCANNTPVYD